MSGKPTITHATRSDVPAILSLIRELADYENAISSVKATEASLGNTLCFAPDAHSPPEGPGYAKTLLLRLPTTTSEQDKTTTQVAGMALYFNNYSTWNAAPGIYLEDLYVKKEYRGRGYGTLLIKALAQETIRIGGMRLEWSCLKWNEPSLKFYRSLGAEEMVDWVGLRADGETLKKLATEAEKEADVKGV